MTAAVKPTRPLMRYHGGKWAIAEWILSFFPRHRVYVEPFGGAGGVLLRKDPSPFVEVYNDLDGAVVSLFRVLRDPEQSERLIAMLERTPFARAEFEATYWAPSPDPVENARRMLFRAYAGFGATAFVRNKTGFRSKDKASNGHAARSWARYPAFVPPIVERLRGIVIEHGPAARVIATHDAPDTLFYVDPPYLLSTRNPRAERKVRNGRGRDGDYAHEMSDADHRALGAVLHAIQGMAVVSGYPSALYDDELFAGWERHERAHRANGGRRRTEVVWLNPACSAALARERAQLSLEVAP